MILILGGTTEGRKAVEVLEEAGSTYYYSTKMGEQDITLHHGYRIDGGLDAESMHHFCSTHDIRLLIDAAHPFATLLHHTVASVAQQLGIPAIRYERIFPKREEDIEWIDDYTDIPHNIHTLLATTGVQSISKLKPLEEAGIKVYYRILERASSIALAHQQGATDRQLCFYEDPSQIPIAADAILLKESGASGGFPEKVAAARRQGMRIIVLKRPATPANFLCVNGPHGLRRAVEHLLPEFFPLKSGLTTGTYATAAAIAATLLLMKKERPKEVAVTMPNDEQIMVPVSYGDGFAYCIKEAGDDPDVTDGIEIRATVNMVGEKQGNPESLDNQDNPDSPEITIAGGVGVGRFTLPGFDYPPGEAAINKGPRAMICRNLHIIAPHTSLHVTIAVPDGSAIASRTFNPRLGIEGGISIIGVSGIVKPFSEEAFIDSIRKCMQVAKASGTDRVVINSGAKSERFVRAYYPDLPRQAFVEYGNYIGQTLMMAHELNIPNITLGVMLGKAVKLAAGNLDTHSRKSTMDKDFVQQMLHEAGCAIDISSITLARELWELIPQAKRQAFVQVVIRRCASYCQPLVPKESLTILLIDDEGNIHR
ncbi:MAG: cobalt-precorrin-5B (C(1))-methyltransferase CbiD [Prevotella sp.]|nr:cobalt-precorrin-5B (C(1))-methyltransferase CbiD [Prevotella sp.]